ncbi:hypothetical protein CEXT_340941 [Caerostris extrusa]|uniref:Uncharacterized protein n=1 Tax=Caerostris extrusa TaxID=172846 RepID=A0AAV4MF49_CAEEX|nr:hypothetical protein CEXT_340941 [Caerostris extrusa]
MHMRPSTALRPNSVCAARAIDEFRSSATSPDRRKPESLPVIRNFTRRLEFQKQKKLTHEWSNQIWISAWLCDHTSKPFMASRRDLQRSALCQPPIGSLRWFMPPRPCTLERDKMV